MDRNLNRRDFLKSVGLTAAALTMPGCVSAGGRVTGRTFTHPNIVFIMADDQRWDLMGCMGNPVIKTPNMDRLADEGVLFENAFLTTSICMASRASVMLSQFESRHQCNFERPSNRTISYAEFDNSYPRLLQKAGYRTGFIGKFGFAVSKDKILNCPLNPDGSRNSKEQLWRKEQYMPVDKFDVWYGFPGQGGYFPKGKDGKHLTQIMGEQAVEFFESCEPGRPFCLSISFKAPHGPTQPDPAYKDMYKDVKIPRQINDRDEYFEKLPRVVREHWRGRRVYQKEAGPEKYQEFMERHYQCISGIDVVIGRIRDELRRLKLDDNTVIIYTSDNGYFCGSKGLGGKCLLYEESIRTKHWKYIRYFEQRPIIEELFDIQNDPIEAYNLTEKSEYSDVLVRLRKLCDDWISKAK